METNLVTYWLMQVTKHGQGIYSDSGSVGTLGNPQVLETASERPQDNHEVLPLMVFSCWEGWEASFRGNNSLPGFHMDLP